MKFHTYFIISKMKKQNTKNNNKKIGLSLPAYLVLLFYCTHTVANLLAT